MAWPNDGLSNIFCVEYLIHIRIRKYCSIRSMTWKVIRYIFWLLANKTTNRSNESIIQSQHILLTTFVWARGNGKVALIINWYLVSRFHVNTANHVISNQVWRFEKGSNRNRMFIVSVTYHMNKLRIEMVYIVTQHRQ